jgi:hypothetical protein
MFGVDASGGVIDDSLKRMRAEGHHSYTLDYPSAPPTMLLHPGGKLQAWVAQQRNARFGDVAPMLEKKDS